MWSLPPVKALGRVPHCACVTEGSARRKSVARPRQAVGTRRSMRSRPDRQPMKRLVLLRHGESIWNQENRFTGWTDVGLSEKGVDEGRAAAKLLRREGYD